MYKRNLAGGVAAHIVYGSVLSGNAEIQGDSVVFKRTSRKYLDDWKVFNLSPIVSKFKYTDTSFIVYFDGLFITLKQKLFNKTTIYWTLLDSTTRNKSGFTSHFTDNSESIFFIQDLLNRFGLNHVITSDSFGYLVHFTHPNVIHEIATSFRYQAPFGYNVFFSRARKHICISYSPEDQVFVDNVIKKCYLYGARWYNLVKEYIPDWNLYKETYLFLMSCPFVVDSLSRMFFNIEHLVISGPLTKPLIDTCIDFGSTHVSFSRDYNADYYIDFESEEAAALQLREVIHEIKEINNW